LSDECHTTGAGAEALLEAPQEGLSERNFWKQDKCLLRFPEALRDASK
jgi:hypothetical protein